MEKTTRESKELFNAILALGSTEECEAFFEDLCTIKEIQDLSQRFQVAKMLSEKKNYQEANKFKTLMIVLSVIGFVLGIILGGLSFVLEFIAAFE